MSKTLADIRKVAPRELLLGAKPRVKGITSDLSALKLNGEDYRATISGAVTEATLERSVELSSIIRLILRDSEGELRRSKILADGIKAEIDDLGFWLSQVERADDRALTLTFEAIEIQRLRALKGPKKALRDKYTRAEFIASLVREVRPAIPQWIPELHIEQPIESTKQARERSQTVGRVAVGEGGGLDPSDGLTVKGAPATKEQLDNGARVLAVGVSLNAPRVALVSAIVTGIQELTMLNHPGGGGGSHGYFQIIPGVSAGGWTAETALDLEATAAYYFKHGFTHGDNSGMGAIYAAEHGIGDAADISSYVEGNAAGSSDRRGWIPEAEKWVDAFGGGGGVTSSSTTTTTSTKVKPYAFEVGANESYWAAIQRLAEEVNWRAFVSSGIFYYIAEPELLNSAVYMRVRDGADGIDSINWSIKPGRKLDEMTVRGRAKSWAAPPGTVAKVSGEGLADGRYITTSITSPLTSTRRRSSEDADITLKRPTEPLPEPAPETSTTTSSSFSVGESSTGVGGDAGTASALQEVDLSQGGWCGTEAIFKQFIHPFMQEQGLEAGAQKETGHDPDGDHDPSTPCSWATDYPTYNGEAAARAIAAALGCPNWVPNEYTPYGYFEIDGHRFRAQILWGAAIEHDDHVHVGVREV